MTGSGREAERTCLGCRVKKNRSQMLRLALVITPHGPKVVWDFQRSRSGRGAWLCGYECLNSALKRRLWGKAFRIQGDLDVSELDISPFGPEKKQGQGS